MTALTLAMSSPMANGLVKRDDDARQQRDGARVRTGPRAARDERDAFVGGNARQCHQVAELAGPYGPENAGRATAFEPFAEARAQLIFDWRG